MNLHGVIELRGRIDERKKGEGKMEQDLSRGMREWREANGKATLREIEAELDERLSQLRAKVLTETANRSEASDWKTGEGPKCEGCGKAMVKRGEAKRRLKTGDGQEITIQRQYASCPACGAGFFPSG